MTNKNLKSIIKEWSFSIMLTGIIYATAYIETTSIDRNNIQERQSTYQTELHKI